MPSLPLLSGREIIKALNKEGFEVVGRKGSHVRMKKKVNGKAWIVTVPDYSEVPTWVLKSIMRQSGMTTEQFLELFN
ncbi:MAG TPA: type II toxin-antitoxin system HicA family toxin [archaeon]|nr:type II toxin-antitoxin system HicA family toxin [archaeon]HLD81320.1 type II toxin-antitoxin system HicA family toxin [archaeon]